MKTQIKKSNNNNQVISPIEPTGMKKKNQTELKISIEYISSIAEVCNTYEEGFTTTEEMLVAIKEIVKDALLKLTILKARSENGN